MRNMVKEELRWLFSPFSSTVNDVAIKQCSTCVQVVSKSRTQHKDWGETVRATQKTLFQWPCFVRQFIEEILISQISQPKHREKSSTVFLGMSTWPGGPWPERWRTRPATLLPLTRTITQEEETATTRWMDRRNFTITTADAATATADAADGQQGGFVGCARSCAGDRKCSSADFKRVILPLHFVKINPKYEDFALLYTPSCSVIQRQCTSSQDQQQRTWTRWMGNEIRGSRICRTPTSKRRMMVVLF